MREIRHGWAISARKAEQHNIAPTIAENAGMKKKQRRYE
jgi:hypothetical protein